MKMASPLPPAPPAPFKDPVEEPSEANPPPPQPITHISSLTLEGPSWSNLPLTVFLRLHSLLGTSFSRTARLISPSWLCWVDQELGHKVTISPFCSPHKLNFIQNVKVLEAVVQGHHLHSKGPFITFLSPSSLKKLTLSGTLGPSFLLRDLQQFPNLQILSIDQYFFLGGQDLATPPPPEGEGPPPPILLPKVFEFNLALRFVGFRSESRRKRLPIELKNLTFLLDHLRLPQLLHYNLKYEADKGLRDRIPTEVLQIESSSFRFLSGNRNLLESAKLIEVLKNECRPYSIFRQRALEITFSKSDRSLNVEPKDLLLDPSDHWSTRFISSSGNLTPAKVKLRLLHFPQEEILQMFHLLTSRTFNSTLTLLKLDFFFTGSSVTLDLSLFSSCLSLEHFHLHGHNLPQREDGPILTVDNFLQLPSHSLRSLRIDKCLLSLPFEPHQLHNFSPKLESLELWEIAPVPEPASDQEWDLVDAQTLQLVREFLNLRNLSRLEVKLSDELVVDPEVVGLLGLAHVDPSANGVAHDLSLISFKI